MTSNNIIIAGIITVSLTVIAALLSDVFSPLSELLKDKISTVPSVTNNDISAKVFDNEKKSISKEISPGDNNVSANSVTFDFKANEKIENIYYFLVFPYSLSPIYQLLPKFQGYEDSYECSFDGQPFEDCSPPKPYYDISTEVMHIFKVKKKGILGNTQDEPATFSFTSVTSSVVKGIVKKYQKEVEDAIVKIEDSNKTEETSSVGRFSFKGIGQGEHLIRFSERYNQGINNPEINVAQPKSLTYEYSIFVPAGIPWLELDLPPLEEMEKSSPVDLGSSAFAENKTLSLKQTIPKNSTYVKEQIEKSEINPLNRNIASIGQINDMSIGQDSQNISKNYNEYLFKTQLWINASSEDTIKNIKNVSYILHHTFIPNTINSTTKENNFTINIVNWGIFPINATVFLNNTKEPIHLELPNEKWKCSNCKW